MSLRDRLLRLWPLFLGLSSFVFLALLLLRTGQPWTATLEPGWDDHVSHRSAALVFFHRGLELYRHPPSASLERAPASSLPRAPGMERVRAEELFLLPERRPPERPLLINWPDFPRVYPPGAWVYAAPELWLQERWQLSDRAMNALSVLKYTAVALLLLFVLLGGLFRDLREANKPWLLALFALLLPGLVLETLRWSLNGFYDGLAILFVLLSVRALREERWERGLLLYSLGCVLHFRALWFLPLAGYALLLGLKSWREGRRPSPAGWLSLSVALGAFAGSLIALLLVYPVLSTFPKTNPFLFTEFVVSPRWLIVLAGIFALVSAGRGRTDLFRAGTFAWALAFLLNTPQVMPWHGLFLLPLLPIAAWEQKPREILLGTGALVLLAWGFFDLRLFDPVGALRLLGAWLGRM